MPSFMAPLEDEQRRGRQKLDEQRQRVGISAHAKTAHDGLLKERLKRPSCPPENPFGQGTELSY